MAIITSAALIRALSLFHISLSYFLIASPSTIVNQSLVFILGASMQLPTPDSFSISSPSITFSALLLALLGLIDLTGCSLPEEIGSLYWGSQAPIRSAFFFTLSAYTFAFKPADLSAEKASSSPWDTLHNSVVFTWSFLEMIYWFWIFVTLREERTELAVRREKRKRAEENMM
ncbi:MAG: hypothetical protein LQ345_000046 [Seirophora villosa]|nr:MAG: hypothetical protein LQ345_000046 [Seirophora villosa]